MRLQYEVKGEPKAVDVDIHYEYLEHVPVTTVVRISNPESPETDWEEGIAQCSPHDQPSKIYGRKLAFSRAVDAWAGEKEHRTALWQAFMKIAKVR